MAGEVSRATLLAGRQKGADTVSSVLLDKLTSELRLFYGFWNEIRQLLLGAVILRSGGRSTNVKTSCSCPETLVTRQVAFAVVRYSND